MEDEKMEKNKEYFKNSGFLGLKLEYEGCIHPSLKALKLPLQDDFEENLSSSE